MMQPQPERPQKTRLKYLIATFGLICAVGLWNSYPQYIAAHSIPSTQAYKAIRILNESVVGAAGSLAAAAQALPFPEGLPRVPSRSEDGPASRGEITAEPQAPHGAAGPEAAGGGGPQLLEAPAKWTVIHDYAGVAGARVYSHQESFACFLVLPDACHVAAGPPSGSWYSLTGQPLAAIVSDADVCGHRNRTLPHQFYPKDVLSIARAEEKMGRLINATALDELLAAKTAGGKTLPGPSAAELRRAAAAEVRAVGMAAPHDSFLGHFVERVGGLSEISEAMAAHPVSAPPSSLLKGATVHFGTDFQVSAFAGNVTRILFGSGTQLLPGRGRPGGRHVCFRQMLFPLNSIFQRGSADAFREKAYAMADGALRATGGRPRRKQGSQVTWLWRSNRRTVVNHKEVMRELVRAFPGLPVKKVEFSENASFWEVVDTMRRSVFALGMHGSAISNAIFMRAGAPFLELLPYKYRYFPHAKTGSFYGLRFRQWTNSRAENARFDNGCFRDEWRSFSTSKCWAMRPCLVCIRDHAQTVVDVSELRGVLAEVSRELRNVTEKGVVPASSRRQPS